MHYKKEIPMRIDKKLILSLMFFSWAIDVQAGNTARPLNIMFVVNHFLPSSQTFILNSITGLIDRGHNVSIFSFYKDNFVDMHPNVEKYKLLDHVIYDDQLCELPECDIVLCQFGYVGQKIFEVERLKKWLKKRK